MLLIAGFIGLLAASPIMSSELGPSAFAEWWSGILYSSLPQTIWSFLGIAAATIIALQLAVQNGDRRIEPRFMLRRQILAAAAMFVGAFVLDALLLTALTEDSSTNLPLVFAAGGILVFMAAEAGTALAVPSLSVINSEKIERYAKARASMEDDLKNAGVAFPVRYPGLRLLRAYAVTACLGAAPTIMLWVFSGDLDLFPAVGLLVLTNTIFQIATVQAALVVRSPGLATETRVVPATLCTAGIIGLSGLFLAAIQLEGCQLAVGFGWSLLIVILSAVKLPGRWVHGYDVTIWRAFNRLHDHWLEARIDRLTPESAADTSRTEIDAIRTWLTDGKKLTGSPVEDAIS
jgi:hypothetical protein